MFDCGNLNGRIVISCFLKRPHREGGAVVGEIASADVSIEKFAGHMSGQVIVFVANNLGANVEERNHHAHLGGGHIATRAHRARRHSEFAIGRTPFAAAGKSPFARPNQPGGGILIIA